MIDICTMRPTLLILAFLALVQAAMTGQKTCNQVICLTGIRDSTAGTDTFTIGPPDGQTIPVSQVGWMAMGFGNQMLNSPMCIMWPNSDGSFTLSQRMATQHVMPTVVANPPRKATFLASQSFANTTSSSFSFSVPSSSDGKTSLIWATSTTKPGSSNPSASIVQHDKMGVMELDLSAALSSGSGGNDGDGDTTSSPSVTQSDGDGTYKPPMALYAHVSFAALATMLFFPLGIITPRYARAFTIKRWWLPTHSALNGILGALCVVVAFCIARNKFGFNDFSTTHQKCGLALFILVLIQVFVGVITHWTKHHRLVERTKFVARRGPLNFLHVTMGLAIVGLGWTTAYEGLFVQWALSSGIGPAGRGYKIAYAVLVGVSGLVYLAGLVFLPRQLRLEKEQVDSASSTPPQVPQKEGRARV